MLEGPFRRAPHAEPQPEYKRWTVEAVVGDPHSVVYTPDGTKYDLYDGDRLVLLPATPEGEQDPQPFVRTAKGDLIPFSEWRLSSAKDKG